MFQICKQCIAVCNFNLRKSAFINIPTSSNAIRHYASTKERTSRLVYKDGKLVTGEVEEDPNLFPKFLMIFTGYDEVTLDAYFSFAKKAAQMADVDLTKYFRMPARKTQLKSHVVKEGDEKEVIEYNFKKYERVIEISNLAGDKSDFYIEFLHKSLPAGVQINMLLDSWERYIDPHSLHASNTTEESKGKT